MVSSDGPSYPPPQTTLRDKLGNRHAISTKTKKKNALRKKAEPDIQFTIRRRAKKSMVPGVFSAVHRFIAILCNLAKRRNRSKEEKNCAAEGRLARVSIKTIAKTGRSIKTAIRNICPEKGPPGPPSTGVWGKGSEGRVWALAVIRCLGWLPYVMTAGLRQGKVEEGRLGMRAWSDLKSWKKERYSPLLHPSITEGGVEDPRGLGLNDLEIPGKENSERLLESIHLNCPEPSTGTRSDVTWARG